MKIKLLTILLALTTAPLVALVANAAGDDAAIISLEKQAWEAYKNKQADAFKGMMTPQYVGVYDDGMKDVNGEVADMKKMDLRSYALSDTKVTSPTQDTALLTFVATVQATYDGKDISGSYNCASLYVKQNGKWLGAFHSEAKAEK